MRGKGMAIAGVSCGAVSLAFAVLGLLLNLVLMGINLAGNGGNPFGGSP